MGVYIKGMEMPTRCEDCPLECCDENYYGDEFDHRCSLIYKGYTSNNRYEKRLDDCPLVPVPPHGDLIDRAALLTKALPKNPNAQFHCVALKDIVMAPTIIEADDKDINNVPNKKEGE